MKKRKMTSQMLTGLALASMLTSVVPVQAFAVTGSQVAKDGTYTKEVTVTCDEDQDFKNYKAQVSLTVANGKISDISFQQLDVLDEAEDNESFINKAINKSNGILTKLKEQPATHDIVQSWDTVGGATCTSKAVKSAVLDLLNGAEEVVTESESSSESESSAESESSSESESSAESESSSESESSAESESEAIDQEMFVLMNIPYAKFYAADVNNSVEVDTVTSATGNKVNNQRFANGAYINGAGKILGVTYPVKVTESMLSGLTEVESEDALFVNTDYAYTVLNGSPSYYKEMTVSEEGVKSFGAIQGTVTTLSGSATLTTESRYGDYEIHVTGLPEGIAVSGVILKTTDGMEYGLRHLENIWVRPGEISFSAGHKTTESHGNALSSAHYKSIAGKTLSTITYVTTSGIYELDVNMYMPIITDASVNVADASVTAKEMKVEITGLPTGFSKKYTINGLEGATVTSEFLGSGATITLPSDAKKGSYTLTVEDSNGIYAPISTSFELYTEEKPAIFDGKTALVAADDTSDEAFNDFISNIQTVTVDEQSYNAKGKHSKTIINADGTINEDESVFANAGDYQITVKATGYLPVTFTYNVEEKVYVMMNIPYEKFYAAELDKNTVAVDTVTSATGNKVTQERFANGGYVNGKDQILGVQYPVKVAKSALDNMTKVDSVAALFTNNDYVYAELTEVPAYYKTMKVSGDTVSFGAISGEVTKLSDVTAEISTVSSYGDYQIELTGLPDTLSKISGVVLKTDDGQEYGLRHLENIWVKVNELSFSTGHVTTERHGNKLSYDHYADIEGKTITSITYYTQEGIYEVATSLKVLDKLDTTVVVSEGKAGSGTLAVSLSEALPSDYQAEYTVEGMSFENGTITYKNMPAGQYTFTITDKGGHYDQLTTNFILKSDTAVVAYGDEKLVALDGVDEATFAAYLKNITKVSVNSKDYAPSGKGSVKIVLEDGSIDLSAAVKGKTETTPVFNGAGEYAMTIEATGYPELSFTLTIEDIYVLMNIPYTDFYGTELDNNDVAVDAVASATLAKTRSTLANGSYHTDQEGSNISGVTFPVKLPYGTDLSAYKQVTDADSYEITVSMKGNPVTTTYAGKDALFENDDYAYYILSEKPAFYKEATITDGKLIFGAIAGDITKIDATAEFTTKSSYGDYELGVDVSTDYFTTSDAVHAAIITTTDGTEYGLRHVENIWRGTELAWSTGFVTETHGCQLSSAHYESMMGKTIDKVTFYTEKGIFEVNIDDVYVPTKFESEAAVADVDVTAGKTELAVALPTDFVPEFKVDGLTIEADEIQSDIAASVKKYELSFGSALPGKYTLVVSDKNKIYADIYTDFTLTTKDIVALYDKENLQLIAAEGITAEAFAHYLSKLSVVNVNGTDYAMTGRGSKPLVDAKTGKLILDETVFAADGSYEITLVATGYENDVVFTYEKNVKQPETDQTPETDQEPETEQTPETDQEPETEQTPETEKVPETEQTLETEKVPETNKTTTAGTPKTGDPMNIWGTTLAALSSIGLGGIGVSLSRRGKKEDEE